MRPTIGVLFGFHIYEGARPAPFSFPIIRGIQAAARDKNVHLMLACGMARRTGRSRQVPAWPEAGPETDFLPVGPWNTDGLLFVTPMLAKRRMRYAQRLAEEGFPVLFLGGELGSPAILPDNESGIRQVLEHLVGHGHRSIAFIAGYEQDPGDSFARLNAYRKGVQELGLSDDPRLLVYGQHWDVGGFDAMRRILESGVKFTAVMCSNDHSAMGAMRALQEAGIRIPQDAAVTGFDDVLETKAQVPPLTSVRYPLFETGYRALLLLHKRIERGPRAVPEWTRVSTWLVPRQSCGCLPDIVVQSADLGGPSSRAPEPSSAKGIDDLPASILDALQGEDMHTPGHEILPLCGRLVEGFCLSLEDGDDAHFQQAATDVLQQVELRDEDSALLWQSAVTELRRAVYAGRIGSGGADCRDRAEAILHRARILLSESIDRRSMRLQVRQTDYDEAMGLLTARLISSSDEDRLYRTLREDLPAIGVRSCRVVFFEPEGEDPVGWSVMHPLEPDSPVMRFETRRFPPPGLYPEGEAHSLALLPVTYRDEKLGYVAFEGGSLDPLATLVRQFASAIKNVQLHARVRELSLRDGLTGLHNHRYFEIMLQKETDRSRRYRRDLAVIMIDIDRFKNYNDAFGHPAGDEALREVGQCIERGARRGLDVVARYGGEEFAIILPETDAAGAMTVAENVRRGVEGSGKLLHRLTVSLGIASMCGEGILPAEVVDRADQALYQAKLRGRNRTEVFEEGSAQTADWKESGPAAEDPPARPPLRERARNPNGG
ncbi:MAG: GGDEF domain-containing protein [Anaerolineales bacterium]|nr:GGDEF domain-containing protein [Anaerolineales bacterium]